MGDGHIFVYGQLKRGFPLYEELDLERRAEFVGEGLLGGATLYNHNGHYPYAVLGTADLVHGEVFKIRDPALLAEMDHEEFVVGYKRLPCTVHVEAIPYRCDVYVQPKPLSGDRIIPSGVWTRR